MFGNNYGRPVIGYQNDLDAMGRREVAAFHARHYAPQNLTVALVGDVDPDQASGRRMRRTPQQEIITATISSQLQRL